MRNKQFNVKMLPFRTSKGQGEEVSAKRGLAISFLYSIEQRRKTGTEGEGPSFGQNRRRPSWKPPDLKLSYGNDKQEIEEGKIGGR